MQKTVKLAAIVIFVQVVFIFLIGISCSKSTKEQQSIGDKSMDTSLLSTIQSLSVNDNKRIDSLVETLRSRAIEQPRQLVELTHNKNIEEQTVEKARMVLLLLGDIALTPIMDALDHDSPDSLVWDLRASVNFHKENQNRIIKRLEQLLGDKRQLTPQEQGPFTEEKHPDRRVCDEVYLMMRQLIAMEDAESSMVNARIFLYSMNEAERDQEIARLRKSKMWIALTEQVDAMPDSRQ
jgi:hypothetical protein